MFLAFSLFSLFSLFRQKSAVLIADVTTTNGKCEMYSYQLEQYKGTVTRYTCPACGTARALVRYVDAQGQHLADDVGRCNRESKCGYHYPPRQYFADHPELRTDRPARRPRYAPPSGIAVREPPARTGAGSDAPHSASATARTGAGSDAPHSTEPTALWTLPAHHFTASLCDYERNAFVQFLGTLFDEPTVRALVERFGIGTARDGRTIFWQLDQTGYVRTGQALRYHAHGKRDKEAQPDWMHSRLARAGHLPAGFQLRQCLFGEHQLRLPQDTDKPCAIVEAPKTAIIATGFLPELVWLATGGKANLSEKRLQALAHRQVVLFPDTDGFAAWHAKTPQLRQVCPTLHVSDLLERKLTEAQKAEGLDLADFLILEAARRGV